MRVIIGIKRGSVGASGETFLTFIIGLVESDAATPVVESVLREEPSPTMDLLRLANSAASSVRHRVTSIAHAIIVLGQHPQLVWTTRTKLPNNGVPSRIMPRLCSCKIYCPERHVFQPEGAVFDTKMPCITPALSCARIYLQARRNYA
jgi:hypothetical protein